MVPNNKLGTAPAFARDLYIEFQLLTPLIDNCIITIEFPATITIYADTVDSKHCYAEFDYEYCTINADSLVLKTDGSLSGTKAVWLVAAIAAPAAYASTDRFSAITSFGGT